LYRWLPIEKRDFTQGRATKLLAELKAKGASFVKNTTTFLLYLVFRKRNVSSQDDSKRLFEHLKSREKSDELSQRLVSHENQNSS